MAPPGTEAMVPESPDQRTRRLTRHRLADEHRRLRHARLADQLMPLAVFYATRRPRCAA